MPLTNFPNGVLATPVVGANKFAGFWTNRVWFVDGANGLDGNSGKDPKLPLKTIARAVALAGRDDTIYIRPLVRNNKYNENITVPVPTATANLEGLSFIGTGNGFGNYTAQAVTIRGVLAVDSPILKLLASHANVENMHFRTRAAQTTAGLINCPNNSGGGTNVGSSIVNCTFSTDMGATATAGVAQKCIVFDSTGGARVEGCVFQDLRMAISATSSASATGGLIIRGNQFLGTAANIACDIHFTDITMISIVGNVFGHGVPSYGSFGGAVYNKYILCNGASSAGTLAVNFQGATDVAAGTNNTLGSLVTAGNFGIGGPWTS